MVIRTAFYLIFSAVVVICNGQVSFEILKPCPEKISNTAVTGITISDNPYVYVFSGIDSSKNYNGIHARSYKYDLLDEEWSVLPELPGGQHRIAAGASTIKDKIYILGGYEVFDDGTEVSLNQLHVFDPLTDLYLDDAAPIPTPIDDHVQLVYQDSLLYSITGWSNLGNVNEVWMYDPISDSWSACTPLPLGPIFSSFGSSGSIVGDTIYFLGGASEIGPFNLSDRFRKGFIHPDDPTQIDWIIGATNNALGYRMGSGQVNGQAFWLGGSQTSYNYDAIAYNGSGVVSPISRLLQYDSASGEFVEFEGLFPAIMDLRGLAQVGPSSFVSVGGFVENQEVTNRVVKYDLNLISYIEDQNELKRTIIRPNPARNSFSIEMDSVSGIVQVEVYNNNGLRVFRAEHLALPFTLDCSNWDSGIYYFHLITKQGATHYGSLSVIRD